MLLLLSLLTNSYDGFIKPTKHKIAIIALIILQVHLYCPGCYTSVPIGP